MTTIELRALHAVCGGYQVLETQITRAQKDTFESCMRNSAGKSRYKPWTWGNKSADACVSDFEKVLKSAPHRIINEEIA